MAASKAQSVPAVAGTAGPLSSSRRPSRLNADTSSEPEGLTRRVVLNVLEAFFRRPWLHLLPLILLLALGASTAFNKKEVFRSTGTITAESSSLIGNLTQSNNPGFGFDTPATATARNINEMLRTNEFLTTVADKLQVDAPPSQQALLRATIAQSVSAFADGDQLVRVGAQTERADLSYRLAQATITAYLETTIANDVGQSNQTVAFFEQQVAEADAARTTAQTNLENYLTENNINTRADDVPLTQQLRVDRLQSEVDRLESVYEAKLDSLDQAKLSSATAQTAVEQRLRLTDAPEQPVAPEPRLKKAVLTLFIFGVLGVMLSLASVIVAATLDRTIRIPGDINAKFGLDVLAVVPDTRAR